MAHLLIEGLDDLTIRWLEECAEQHKTTPSALARTLLAEAVRSRKEEDVVKPSRQEVLAELKRIRAMSPPTTIDSTDLIREDRDSR